MARHRRHHMRHNRRRVYRRRRHHHLMNPHHRRRHYRYNPHHRRRHYRRNPPSLAGINLTDLLKGASAVILAPLLEKQIMPLLPASISGTSYGRWAVKIGGAIGIWYLAKVVFGSRSAEVAAIALGATLIADAATEFMPSLTGSTAAYLGAYMDMPRRGLGYANPGIISGAGDSRAFGTVASSPSMPDDIFRPPF